MQPAMPPLCCVPRSRDAVVLLCVSLSRCRRLAVCLALAVPLSYCVSRSRDAAARRQSIRSLQYAANTSKYATSLYSCAIITARRIKASAIPEKNTSRRLCAEYHRILQCVKQLRQATKPLYFCQSRRKKYPSVIRLNLFTQ